LDAARRAAGLAFAGRVLERCAACDDDAVEVLMDRPFSYAPYGGAAKAGAAAEANPNAPLVRAGEGGQGWIARPVAGQSVQFGRAPREWAGDSFAAEARGTTIGS
jgi:hypothetical protein